MRRFYEWYFAWPDQDRSWTLDREVGKTTCLSLGSFLDRDTMTEEDHNVIMSIQ